MGKVIRVVMTVILTLTGTAVVLATENSAPTNNAVSALECAGAVRLAGVFTDHAVLQRDMPVPVWGWAPPGAKVTVVFAWQKKEAVADARGAWKVALDAMPACAEPRELIVSSDNQKSKSEVRKVTDVLVGEVWLAAGQSNMITPVKGTTTAATVIAKAGDPQLRLGGVRPPMTAEPQRDLPGGQWSLSTPECAGNYSAVAYVFGRELRKALGVPVGMWLMARGCASCQAWTPRETMQANPALRHYVAQSEKELAAYDSGELMRKYEIRAEQQRQAAARALAEGRPAPRPATPPIDPRKAPWQAVQLYNGAIAPLMPFAMRGVVWYQIEANNPDPTLETLFPAMIQSWRQGFANPAMPFLFVQYPSYRNCFPMTREIQTRCAERVSNAAMVVTLDVGEADNIHPGNKEPVGVRLALKARALVYGEKIEHSGPVFDSRETRGDKLVLHFRHADSGLVAHGGEVRGFEIAGEDGKYHPARAGIEGRDVVLSSPEVKEPTHARYAWAAVPDANLFNGAGLPAGPFRTAGAPE